MFAAFRMLEETIPADKSSIWQVLSMLAPFAILIAVFYFFMIRPQKKQQRETAAMRENIDRGDVITTIGGIVGIVVMVKDDNILIETSGDKTRVQVQKWAVRSIEQKAE